MSHCVVVAPLLFNPVGMGIALAAIGVVGAGVGVSGALAANRRIRASRTFRQSLLGVLDDLVEQGVVVEECELEADTVAMIETHEGTFVPVRQQADGSYALAGPTAAELTESIMQQYAYEAVKRDLADEGFRVVCEEVNDDGAIKLLARRFSNEREEVEALLPAHGPVRYQGFGMPPHTCGDTVERLAQKLGRVVERQYHTQEVEHTMRLFQTV